MPDAAYGGTRATPHLSGPRKLAPAQLTGESLRGPDKWAVARVAARSV